MNYRFADYLWLAIALCCVSPLCGDDEPPAEPKAPPAAAAESGESSEPAAAPVAEVNSEAELAPAGEAAAHSNSADAASEKGTASESSGEAHGEGPQPAVGEASHDAGHDSHSGGGGDHGGGHGDPLDLSHVNASSEQESPQAFQSDLAIWTFVVFICLLIILGKFAWGPITQGLEKREQSIAAMIEEAKQSQEKAAAQLKQYEAKIAAAGEESREILAQARKDAEAAGERIVAAAEAAAEKQRERAVADIANATNAALNEIKTEGVNLAVQLAGRIVRRELNSQDHSQLIDEALKQLPSRN